MFHIPKVPPADPPPSTFGVWLVLLRLNAFESGLSGRPSLPTGSVLGERAPDTFARVGSLITSLKPPHSPLKKPEPIKNGFHIPGTVDVRIVLCENPSPVLCLWCVLLRPSPGHVYMAGGSVVGKDS